MSLNLKKILLTLLLVGMVGGVGAIRANAVFTSVATNGANTFSSGTIVISTSPSSAFITFSAMVPGDTVTQPLTVSNTGSAQLRYAVSSTTTENVLATQLALTLKTGVTTCTNAGFASSGTVVYGPGALGNTTAINVIGNPSQGAQSGDRTLNASASEVLCTQVALPLSTGNTFQGLTTTATFAFDAEQTSNNP